MFAQQTMKPQRKQREAPMQEAILEVITDYKRTNDGNSPTYQEIAEMLGKHAANVYRYVQSLERRGIIRFTSKGKIVLVGGQYIPPE